VSGALEVVGVGDSVVVEEEEVAGVASTVVAGGGTVEVADAAEVAAVSGCSFEDSFEERSSRRGSSCLSKQSNISLACCDPSSSILNNIDSSLSSGLSSVLLMYAI